MARISLSEFCAERDIDRADLLEEYALEDVVPALCDEDCEVEPDGYCPHDCPSVLLALGVI